MDIVTTMGTVSVGLHITVVAVKSGGGMIGGFRSLSNSGHFCCVCGDSNEVAQCRPP